MVDRKDKVTYAVIAKYIPSNGTFSVKEILTDMTSGGDKIAEKSLRDRLDKLSERGLLTQVKTGWKKIFKSRPENVIAIARFDITLKEEQRNAVERRPTTGAYWSKKGLTGKPGTTEVINGV